jgi:hypothetical protein
MEGGRLVAWRCYVTFLPLVALAAAATALRLGIEVCAVCAHALDAWRRE